MGIIRRQQPNWLIGLVAFGIVFLLTIIINNTSYPYDSGNYDKLSKSFFVDGQFALTNFESSIRGVIFPLFLAPFNIISEKLIGSEFFGWRFFISLFSGAFVIAFQYIFKAYERKRMLLLPLILTLITWYGLFLAPLSDLIAAYLLVFSLACINIAYSRVRENTWSLTEVFLFFLTGVFLYAAYNTRTVFLFACPFILLIIFANRKVGRKKSLLILLVIIIGVGALGSLQGAVNFQSHGEFTPAVITKSNKYKEGLFLFQLSHGIPIGLYETYMGPDVDNHAYRYSDPAGAEILKVREVKTDNYKEYFKTILKHPIDSLGLYTRHFLVLMNPIDGGGYVYSHNNSRAILTLLNYSMIFIVISFLRRKSERRSEADLTFRERISALTYAKKTSILSVTTLLAPFIAIIPGAIEERFALPFWLILYGLLSYVINLKDELRYYRKNLAISIVYYCVGFAILMAVVTLVYANNPQGMLVPILELKR